MIGLPADFADARNLIDLTGKSRSTSTRRINSPTAPVAPTTATFGITFEALTMRTNRPQPLEAGKVGLGEGRGRDKVRFAGR